MAGARGCLAWMLALCVCASLGWAGPAPRPTLHLHLSPEELRETFAVEHHSDVPEYDLFHVRSMRRRSARHRRRVHVRAFGNELDLDLELNQHMQSDVRMFFADTPEPGGDVTIERVRGDTEFHVGELFQDVERQAALLVSHAADDTLQINGVVDDLVVAPAPLRLHQHYPVPADDDMLFLDDHEDGEPSFMNETGGEHMNRWKRDIELTRGLHVVYRLKDQAGVAGGELLDLKDDEVFLEQESQHGESYLPSVNDIPSVRVKSLNRTKRDTISSDLYPEVIVIVDYDTYAVHNYNAQTAKKYIMSFMNAVDIRYKALSSPSISINVAGIVISKSQQATPYLEENLVEDNALDAVSALASIGRYLFNEHRLPSYDAALVMTKRDMCTKNGQWGNCNKVTAGYAYVGGGCSISRYFNKINSVALVEDSAGFSGIIVATHELGHLMGAVHDGSPPASYLGGPGALSCPWEDGYIMSDMRRDYKGLRWSVCTMNQFNHFANDRRSKCMRNLPSVRQGITNAERALPGKLISVDAQCKRDRGSSACFKDHRVCAELYCFEPSTGYCVSFRPAAEGSSCGEGMHCRDGFCTPQDYIY